VAVVYKITYPSDRARARRLERPRHTLNRAGTEQEERYAIPPFRSAQLRRVRHWICGDAPDAAEPVLDHLARAA